MNILTTTLTNVSFVGMEALDGIVKNPVCQDSMVIYVRRYVSVYITCVINIQGVNHDRVRHKPMIENGILVKRQLLAMVQRDEYRIPCQVQSCFLLVRLQQYSLVEHLFIFERDSWGYS